VRTAASVAVRTPYRTRARARKRYVDGFARPLRDRSVREQRSRVPDVIIVHTFRGDVSGVRIRARRPPNDPRLRPAETAPALQAARRANRDRSSGHCLRVARRRGRPERRYRSHDTLAPERKPLRAPCTWFLSRVHARTPTVSNPRRSFCT